MITVDSLCQMWFCLWTHSPDVILCNWLGSKHQLTNCEIIDRKTGNRWTLRPGKESETTQGKKKDRSRWKRRKKEPKIMLKGNNFLQSNKADVNGQEYTEYSPHKKYLILVKLHNICTVFELVSSSGVEWYQWLQSSGSFIVFFDGDLLKHLVVQTNL